MYKIPFNKPTLVGTEISNLIEAIHQGHYSGDGIFTKKCSQILEAVFEYTKVLLTTSCTHALEMSAILANIHHGDEFIVPSFTFVSTVNAFVLRGATPVFIDILPDTLNLDHTRLQRLITPRTKAIVPVHYAGVGCEMDIIMEIADHYGIIVVEDNAHGLFGKYKGRYLGTIGQLGTQSFHETKNFTCGEGGALLINYPDLIERAEIIREKGTNRSRFFRGQVDKYTWVDMGSSYLPSDLLAAFLLAQLEAREQIQIKRAEIWNRYYLGLQEWSEERGVQLPFVPNHCEQTYHMFYILLPSLQIRHDMIEYLKSFGIQSVFHYLPLHLSDMGTRVGDQLDDCQVTIDISDRLLRLPFYNSLKANEQDFIIDMIRNFRWG
jgi:dTDP-4-amino-4,6-dideoxygalactose transaminase